MTKTVLIADDDLSVRTVLVRALEREGYKVNATDNGATLYQWVAEGQGDLVIADVMMPGENGLDLIPKIQSRRPGLKVVIMSAQNALTTAVAAAEKGALDFLPKPFDLDQLVGIVKGAFKNPAREQNNAATARAMDKSFVVGNSRAMQEIYRTIARLTNADLTVLISGESGTGKEVIARALHGFSKRKDKPFVAINMAAIPRELIESELFGHERGAFTGASQKVIGRFAQAHGGTLFLDEIGDMPYEAQTRLLRVLQEGEFTAVGSRRAVKTDVRIVAATNKDLLALVRQGSFREDLYYRLNVVPLRVPSLRERAEDIPALVQHFLNGALKVFTPEAMVALQAHTWPGNIRELESFVRRLVVLHADDVIEASDLVFEQTAIEEGDLAVRLVEAHFSRAPGLYDRILRLIEKPLIEKMLIETNGNQIKAAEMLGLNRNTLRKKIRDLGVEVKR